MRQVVSRILSMIPAMFGVVVVIFILTRVLPGDPARSIAGEQAAASTIAKLRTEMGLDASLPTQFFRYINDLAHGDLGFSWHTGHSVLSEFASRFPATLELSLFAIVIALVIGLPVGIISAVRRDGPIDHVSRILSLAGASMPLFWLGLMMIYIFFARLGWEPPPLGRIGNGIQPPTQITGLYVPDALLTGDFTALRSSISQIIWPAVCLATGSIAVIARMTRSEMLEVLSQDYVRTAVSKGLSPVKVILKHALKNAAPVISTIIGLQFGYLIGGAVITEIVFAWPGVGNYVVQSIMATDYAPVQAFTLLSAMAYLVINLVVDLINARLDPRVSHA